MARDTPYATHARTVRHLLLTVLVLCLASLVLIWRIDNPRVERIRTAVIDRVVPGMEWAMAPVTGLARMADGFQSYARLYEQNQELRREVRQMRAWREAALQLEQENARLLDLNRVHLDPDLTFVTGMVLADSGSPFHRSVLLNVGARDGILDGWVTMDGLGVVGRISGVGGRTARVLLLTDSSSRVPVTIQPSGQRALLWGDNSITPVLKFIEYPEYINAGDRVVTSGNGSLFPAGLLVGHVVMTADGRMRTDLAADYARLYFLRVMRSHPGTMISDPGNLVGLPRPPLTRMGSSPEGSVPEGQAPEIEVLADP
ncbi:MAG: rod shape-determining protein MreC [Rhodobacteraceae bacterium]|nr:rod shape-determining protein MreC [Paracoccaceae bacterium]